MLRYIFPSILLAVGAGACSGTAAPTLEDSQTEEQAHTAAPKTRLGGTCKVDADCAATAFCDDLGYGPARCGAKRADGAFCSDARECKTGACTSYVCGAPAPVCAKTAAGCTTDSDCCVGSCAWDSYGPTPSHCYAPQANGSYCSSNRACTSGRCDQYVCKAAAAACASLGTTCTSSADCCGNGFCNTDTYGPFKCTAPRAGGAWCLDATECQSRSCVSYVCE